LHTPDQSPIAVSARHDGGCVRVEVADTGPGIPASDRERLFKLFERGATVARGSGLGLAIARGFVEAHAGRIWVEDAPQGGARIIFTLPLESEHAA
jgi:signal transduction histidine kinase